MIVQRNAKRAMEHLKERGVDKSPRWVKALDTFFGFDGLEAVRMVSEGRVSEPYTDVELAVISYLNNEIEILRCQQCKKEYEGMKKTTGFCSGYCVYLYDNHL